jgi:hypothetical protein
VMVDPSNPDIIGRDAAERAAALVLRAPRGSRETAGLPSGCRSSTLDVAEPSGSANMQVSDGSEGAPGGGRTHTRRILRTQDRGHCGKHQDFPSSIVPNGLYAVQVVFDDAIECLVQRAVHCPVQLRRAAEAACHVHGLPNRA